jgi:hypothetical protein
LIYFREAPKVINNYKIIQKRSEESTDYVFYLFGKEDCLFSSISSILEFYSTHYLNQSPLVKPAFHHKKVVALYDFNESQDPSEDLYFKEGEILTIIEYTQGNEWWKAINQIGKCGLIPVPLIRRIKPVIHLILKKPFVKMFQKCKYKFRMNCHLLNTKNQFKK